MPLVDVAAPNDPELDGIIEMARRPSTPKPARYQTLASNPVVAKLFAQCWDNVFRGARVERGASALTARDTAEATAVATGGELEPIDPDHQPSRTLALLAAEHPVWQGLVQLAASLTLPGDA